MSYRGKLQAKESEVDPFLGDVRRPPYQPAKPPRGIVDTANVFFSLYLRSQIRIGFCSLLRVLVRCVTCAAENAPGVEVVTH